MTSSPESFDYPRFTFGVHRVFDKTFDSGWVTFPGHYLLYSSKGAFRLEVNGVRWLLPPQRAAWVAAHVPLRLYAEAAGTTSSVLFAENAIPAFDFRCRVFAVSTLAREMLLHAMRWGPDREGEDGAAQHFFLALANLCLELADHPDDYWLPCARSEHLGVALVHSLDHLSEDLTFDKVADAAAVSERTLARRFIEETGMTWRQFMRRARMIRAMELLVNTDSKVIDIVFEVGYTSVSAFNHAFQEFTGQSPTTYRKRHHLL